jgi:cytidylate kinase
VICISRGYGAAGEEVGRLTAERLGYRYLDGEILAHAAEAGGLNAGMVADAEQRRSLARRLADAMREGAAIAPEAYALMPAQELATGARGEDVRRLIREAIEQFAGAGRAVIVAHAASHALAGRDGVLRVLVTASPTTRAMRVADDLAVDEAAARRQVADADRARADYLSRFYDVSEERPEQYDVVVNTDLLTADRGADIVVTAAG